MDQSRFREPAQIDLRTLTSSGGCGCKMSAARLESVLSDVDTHLVDVLGEQPLVREDAARFEVGPVGVLLSTVDFGTPVAANGSTWGRIATMNALSDIYAMGGRPQFALSILGWPASQPVESAAEVLRGAVEALNQEGVRLIGGHTISSIEPIFGLSVLGMQPDSAAFSLSAAQPGDALVLTKPLGTGVILAGAKAGLATLQEVTSAEEVMCESNRRAAELGAVQGVRAATDVSGYGFVGHALAMAKASGVSVSIEISKVPVIEGARRIAMQGVYPNLAEESYFEFSSAVFWDEQISMLDRLILCDPQTSGGLLLSVDSQRAELLMHELAAAGLRAEQLGRVQAKADSAIIMRP